MLLVEQMAQEPNLCGEAFNFSNEMQMTVLQLVRKILAVMQSDLQPDIRNEACNEIRDQYLSAAKARRVLGWNPVFSLEEGLERTVSWYGELFANPKLLRSDIAVGYADLTTLSP